MKEAPKEIQTKLRLQLLRGKQRLGSFTKDGDQVLTIGSSRTADVTLPGKKVSGIHAMLRLTADNDIILYDLGSKHGTFLLGKRIVQSSIVKGNKFRVGDQHFQLETYAGCRTEDGPEEKLFWSANSKSHEVLDVAVVTDRTIRDIYHLEASNTLETGYKEDQIYLEGESNNQAFIARKKIKGDESAYCYLPHGFVAEVFDKNNKLVGTVEQSGEYFCINSQQKARLTCENTEIQIYWRSMEQRFERGVPDPESKKLKESLSVSFALSLIIVAILSFMPNKDNEDELAGKKSSYYRITNRLPHAPAPAPAPAAAIETVDQVVEAKTVARRVVKKINKPTVQKVAKKVPPKPSKSTLSVQSALSNLFKKTSKKHVATSNRGRKVMQASIIPTGGGSSASLKTSVSSQSAGSVNMGALSQSLKKGRATNLRGFKGGVGVGSVLGSGVPNIDVGLGDSDAQTSGGLDKSVIARIVRAHLGQIKQCYERQLLVDPNLFGKVVAKWTIGSDGKVVLSGIKKSTMGHRAVENCVVGKIRHWKFPKPKGGGKVIVSYPFLFKSIN